MVMQKTWQGPEPEQITMWTIVQAGHKAGQQFYRHMNKVGLTPTQFGVLITLDRNPDISNGALARQVHVAPQSMSELLVSLESEDLVKRSGNVMRGKKTVVSLTELGRQKLQACQAIIQEIESSSALTKAELNRVNTLLHKMIDG